MNTESDRHGSPLTGGSIHSTIVSNCLASMAAARTADLIGMLSCREGDLSCLRPSGEAPSWEDDKSARPTSSGIRFDVAHGLGRFQISGLWFPLGFSSYEGLVGVALFDIVDAETRQSISTTQNDVAILPKTYWPDLGVPDATKLGVAELVKRLRSKGPLRLSLAADDRARIGNCSLQPGESTGKKAHSDQCLHIGSAFMDLQDVDFDGQPELIFRRIGVAQRGGEVYHVIKPAFDARQESRTDVQPFDGLDSLSEINVTKKQIVLHESNGACASAWETYGFDSRQGPGLRPIARLQYVSKEGSCSIEEYRPAEAPGKGWQLTLSSRKAAND